MAERLTPKQLEFCKQYVKTSNASEAYRRAYDAENMAQESIAVEASRLLDSPKVALMVEQMMEHGLRAAMVTAERVMTEYSKLAFLDIRKAFDDGGRLKPIPDLDDDTAAAIAGIEFEEIFEYSKGERNKTGQIHKIKLADKKAALDSLAKVLKMMTDKLEINGEIVQKRVIGVSEEDV